jgi:hypothetical protein
METTNPLDAFGLNHLPFDGKLDIEYFCDQPNASVARAALTFLEDGGNEIELHKRHTSSEVNRLWRSTFRACIAHGVPLSDNQKQYARMLGVVLP